MGVQAGVLTMQVFALPIGLAIEIVGKQIFQRYFALQKSFCQCRQRARKSSSLRTSIGARSGTKRDFLLQFKNRCAFSHDVRSREVRRPACHFIVDHVFRGRARMGAGQCHRVVIKYENNHCPKDDLHSYVSIATPNLLKPRF